MGTREERPRGDGKPQRSATWCQHRAWYVPSMFNENRNMKGQLMISARTAAPIPEPTGPEARKTSMPPPQALGRARCEREHVCVKSLGGLCMAAGGRRPPSQGLLAWGSTGKLLPGPQDGEVRQEACFCLAITVKPRDTISPLLPQLCSCHPQGIRRKGRQKPPCLSSDRPAGLEGLLGPSSQGAAPEL